MGVLIGSNPAMATQSWPAIQQVHKAHTDGTCGRIRQQKTMKRSTRSGQEEGRRTKHNLSRRLLALYGPVLQNRDRRQLRAGLQTGRKLRRQEEKKAAGHASNEQSSRQLARRAIKQAATYCRQAGSQLGMRASNRPRQPIHQQDSYPGSEQTSRHPQTPMQDNKSSRSLLNSEASKHKRLFTGKAGKHAAGGTR